MKKELKQLLGATAALGAGVAASIAFDKFSKWKWGRSAQASLVSAYLRATGLRQTLLGQDLARFDSFVEQKREANAKEYRLPQGLLLTHPLFEDQLRQMKYFHLNMHGNNKQVIIFLHGGSYVSQISRRHWHYLDLLAEKSDAEIVVPIYPLAPNHDYDEAFSLLLDLYRSLGSRYSASQISIYGDSAGGGLALALCNYLVEEGLEAPENLILASPLLDLSLRNPNISDYFDLDPLLAPWGVAQLGQLWADGDDIMSPKLSPINAPLTGLKHIYLSVGTREILYPDCMKFAERCDAEGIDLKLEIGQGLNHCWPLYPTPEALRYLDKLCQAIRLP